MRCGWFGDRPTSCVGPSSDPEPREELASQLAGADAVVHDAELTHQHPVGVVAFPEAGPDCPAQLLESVEGWCVEC